jgi:hypothetical protein
VEPESYGRQTQPNCEVFPNIPLVFSGWVLWSDLAVFFWCFLRFFFGGLAFFGGFLVDCGFADELGLERISLN